MFHSSFIESCRKAVARGVADGTISLPPEPVEQAPKPKQTGADFQRKYYLKHVKMRKENNQCLRCGGPRDCHNTRKGPHFGELMVNCQKCTERNRRAKKKQKDSSQ